MNEALSHSTAASISWQPQSRTAGRERAQTPFLRCREARKPLRWWLRQRPQPCCSGL